MTQRLSTLIKWSRNEYALRKFVEVFAERLPVIISITTGFAGGDGVMHELGTDDMYWVFGIQRQKRVVARDVRDQYISIPLNYSKLFQPVGAKPGSSGQTPQRRPSDDPKTLASIVFDKSLGPIRGQRVVSVEDDHNMAFDFRDYRRSHSAPCLGEMELIDIYDEKYLLAYTMLDDEIYSTVVALPVYMPVTLRMAEGFQDRGLSDFDIYRQQIADITSSFLYNPVSPCQEILVFDEEPSGGDFAFARRSRYFSPDTTSQPLQLVAHDIPVDPNPNRRLQLQLPNQLMNGPAAAAATSPLTPATDSKVPRMSPPLTNHLSANKSATNRKVISKPLPPAPPARGASAGSPPASRMPPSAVKVWPEASSPASSNSWNDLTGGEDIESEDDGYEKLSDGKGSVDDVTDGNFAMHPIRSTILSTTSSMSSDTSVSVRQNILSETFSSRNQSQTTCSRPLIRHGGGGESYGETEPNSRDRNLPRNNGNAENFNALQPSAKTINRAVPSPLLPNKFSLRPEADTRRRSAGERSGPRQSYENVNPNAKRCVPPPNKKQLSVQQPWKKPTERQPLPTREDVLPEDRSRFNQRHRLQSDGAILSSPKNGTVGNSLPERTLSNVSPATARRFTSRAQRRDPRSPFEASASVDVCQTAEKNGGNDQRSSGRPRNRALLQTAAERQQRQAHWRSRSFDAFAEECCDSYEPEILTNQVPPRRSRGQPPPRPPLSSKPKRDPFEKSPAERDGSNSTLCQFGSSNDRLHLPPLLPPKQPANYRPQQTARNSDKTTKTGSHLNQFFCFEQPDIDLPPTQPAPPVPISQHQRSKSLKSVASDCPRMSPPPLPSSFAGKMKSMDWTTWRMIGDVPIDMEVSTLDVSQLIRCAQLIGVEQKVVNRLRRGNIDGNMLIDMVFAAGGIGGLERNGFQRELPARDRSVRCLMERLRCTPDDAVKLMLFVTEGCGQNCASAPQPSAENRPS